MMSRAGTFTRLAVYEVAAGGNWTFTLRINGVGSTLTVVATGLAATTYVGTGSVSYAINDLVSIQTVNNSGAAFVAIVTLS